MNSIDIGPSSWDDARDGAFYRIVADLFPPAFLAGATVLLASYDDEHAAARERISIAG